MALNEIQQFISLIEKANNVLVCFKREFNFDDVCSSISLISFLEKQNKKITVVCDNFKLPKELGFLNKKYKIESELKNLQQLVISLDLNDKKINEFSYDVKDDKLKIFVLPETGEIEEDDIKFDKTAFRFDLVINVGASDLESLGNVFTKNTDFFFNTTVVNIDVDLKNENYGQINFVNPNKSSISEIVFELIKEIDENLMDNEMATDLLAGVIAKTKSFKTENIGPQTLKNVSELIVLGADKEKILNNFYRTKKVSTLRLWGRVLARLQYDVENKLVWSSLPYNDFIKSGANEEDVKGVVDELILNSPQAEVVLLIFEKKNNEIAFELYTTLRHDSKYLLNNYEISGTRNFIKGILKDKKLKEVENELVESIKEKL
jgi:phosphoesterase RecJ-like protein